MNSQDEKDICKKCGGWCCNHNVMYTMKPEFDPDSQEEFDFLTMKCVDWMEFGFKKRRWFYMYQPCRHSKDGWCEIYKSRPDRCKVFPKDGPMHPPWAEKCELYKRRQDGN
jgi:Fe-S-cluster containining protein